MLAAIELCVRTKHENTTKTHNEMTRPLIMAALLAALTQSPAQVSIMPGGTYVQDLTRGQ